MPRETIRVHSDSADIFDMKVGWEKDRHMQIGLEHFEMRSLFWILAENKAEFIGEEARKIFEHFNESPEKTFPDNEVLGKMILNILDCATSGPVASIWTSPSRHEVNELIRVLRRARDSAFGRDE